MDRLAHRKAHALRVGWMSLERACHRPICRLQIRLHQRIRRRILRHLVQLLRSRPWLPELVVGRRWAGPSCEPLVVDLAVLGEDRRFRWE